MSESGPDVPAGGGDNAQERARRPERPPVRALDPATAMRLTDGRPPLPALYVSDRLLVRDGDTGWTDDLGASLDRLGLGYEVTPRAGAPRELRGGAWGTSITLVPRRSIEPVDAWEVLQRLREAGDPVAERLSLEHVLRPADGYWGGIGGYWGGIGGYWGGIGGYWGGIGGYWGGIGGPAVGASALQEYSVPGRGGRMPVSLALPDPALRARKVDRRPVVALLDTPVADHPWFRDSERLVRLRYENGHLVPDNPPVTSPDASATSATSAATPAGSPPPAAPVGLLQGHATFIAGLIRQGCPEATVLSVPVMDDDGVVDESHALDVLEALLDRHERGQKRGGNKADVVDILSLSMGYYAEDGSYASGPVAAMLDRFAAAGVTVVAGAGNDGTSSPFVPASLAAALPGPKLPQVPPVSSVGACNPDGTTVALFSNPLTLITATRPGVSLVSTLPLTNGMGQPSSSITGDDNVRCTVDPDDYTGGFGVWSGTSFSTPVFAAELAASLVEQGGLKDVRPDAMCARSLHALHSCTGKDPS